MRPLGHVAAMLTSSCCLPPHAQISAEPQCCHARLLALQSALSSLDLLPKAKHFAFCCYVTVSCRTLLLIMLLGPNCIAGSLGVPVMTIGIKRYTHEGNRGFAFALFYTLMNCSALTQVSAGSHGCANGLHPAAVPMPAQLPLVRAC